MTIEMQAKIEQLEQASARKTLGMRDAYTQRLEDALKHLAETEAFFPEDIAPDGFEPELRAVNHFAKAILAGQEIEEAIQTARRNS